MSDIDKEELAGWLSTAYERGSTDVMIMRDETDGIVFPLYIDTTQNVDVIMHCFISESRMKILEVIKIVK